MKSFLISDNRDTYVGMRLAGIHGEMVFNRDEALTAINRQLNSKDVGILILTEKVIDMVKDEVLELKLKSNKPLIVEIPDRHGSNRGFDAISGYIKDSIGIKMHE